MRLVTAYHGRIVSCIAEREVSRLQVHQSDEKGYKHALLVVFRQRGIHAGTDFSRIHLLSGKRTEQSGGLSHEQRGRHPFT